MSLTGFIKKVCVQRAMYWAPGTPNGFGGFVFPAPVEILVRWSYVKSWNPGTTTQSIEDESEILLTQDVEVGGWLWLGDSAELEIKFPGALSPLNVTGAKEIRKFMKTPMIKSSTVFVRTAKLKENG